MGWPPIGRIKRIKIIGPYCLKISSHSRASSLGKSPKRIVPPSKGGTGKRLKSASTIFKVIMALKIGKRVNKIGDIGIILKSKESKIPRIMFDPGPAREIKAASLLGFFKLKGSIGTGLPQPKRKINKAKVPKGSRWARGFKVRRSLILGVGSPSLSATKA